jgi:hypothetical protein
MDNILGKRYTCITGENNIPRQNCMTPNRSASIGLIMNWNPGVIFFSAKFQVLFVWITVKKLQAVTFISR